MASLTTETPLVDVLIASLRMESCNQCQALADLFSMCQGESLEERIRLACSRMQNKEFPDYDVTKYLALMFHFEWDGADEKVQHAIHRLVLNRPPALVAIFDDIVYPMFQDPDAKVAINLR
jgi:hypothetical protein